MAASLPTEPVTAAVVAEDARYVREWLAQTGAPENIQGLMDRVLADARTRVLPRVELRVVWQRVGQARKRSLYQTLAGAVRCAERQASAHDEMDWLPEPLPELIGPPVIEEREVGPWVASAATEDVRV